VLLAEQDRTRWDRALIEEGQAIVRWCLRRNQPGAYQLQAAINAVHADAQTAEDTDWSQIIALYDHLLAVAPTPVVALNRAIAIGELRGPAAALVLVNELDLKELLPLPRQAGGSASATRPASRGRRRLRARSYYGADASRAGFPQARWPSFAQRPGATASMTTLMVCSTSRSTTPASRARVDVNSFGGLLVQMLAGRGRSVVTVAIDPGPFRGVLPLPISSGRQP
jgi:hypothetical protein